MALGVDSFSLLETVGSFGALCGYGIPVIPYGITEIKQRDNLRKKKRKKSILKEIITKEIQLKIKKLLRAVIEEGTY